MARYTGPTTRINRRFGMAIFPPNKAFERKNYPPGSHGSRMRRKQSEYSIGLAEKQKLRYTYGMTEKQFRRTFQQAKRAGGVTGEVFLQLLETRLDNVIYRMNLAKTRSAARQFVNHGHILVNGGKVDIPSFRVSPGDEIEVKDATSSKQLATRALDETRARLIPEWASLSEDTFKGKILRLPTREEIEVGINEQLIVEFYSR